MTSVLVIGGGIGGLSAAIALRRAGVNAEVFEQAAGLREIGAGLSLWTNGYKALEVLGLGAAIGAVTSPFDVIETRGINGRILGTLPLDQIHQRFGAPSVGIHRRELLAILSEALPPDAIHTGARLHSLELKPDCVIARFHNGRTETADAVVGADGIFSTVRSEILSPRNPKYGGYVVWRGVVTADVPRDWSRHASVRTVGRDQHFGIIELTQGRYFWYATRNQAKDEPEPGGRKAELLRNFGRWHDPIPQLLESTPEEDMLRHGLYRMPPLREWSRSRVTLLGDAAHPMAPSLGQGACQALEDAVILGHAFELLDPITAIQSYERARKRRARSIVRWSRFFAAQEQVRNPILVAARDAQTVLTPSWVGVRLFNRFLSFEPARTIP